MTICRLLQLDYKRQPLGIKREDAYDEHNLKQAIDYCEWLIEIGVKIDIIGHWNVKNFLSFCKRKLQERKTHD